MLTKKDIDELEKVFATKNDLKNMQEAIVKEVHAIIDIIGNQSTRINDNLLDINHHERQLQNHEDRIEALEERHTN